MLVMLASVSGAPGVSAAAVGLAALWPGGPGVVVEADPCGGVLAARFGVAQEPGLAGLAAASRHGLPAGGPARFAQPLPPGVHAVVGPGAADTCAQAVSVLSARPDVVAGLAPVVILDAGRLYPGSPAWGLVPRVSVLVVVTAGDTEHLDHVDTRLPALRAQMRSPHLGVAVCGRSAYGPREVSGRLGAPVWAHLPADRWGAAVLTGRLAGPAWTRTRLAQALRGLAAALAAPPRQPAAAGAALEVAR
ncbi:MULTISPECIES: hypothetical protein [unclassified Micromonospora]|uniref:hypothetical protein n=1 Tax=unclassified Micromonospora TaxID=2617518 RepID=UPI001C243290|nr:MULTISPECIES: hypothetical protein [unclassified Micromonospora]MBU8857781.1 hypothetical protein [Micromonospora sp. WMMB482]MDM4783410.1 hypothetical protein [Micromonospora sp. b486]